MKKALYIVILFAFATFANAQTSLLNFTETDILIEGVSTHVITTVLKGEMDDVSKAFDRFAKEQLDVKLKTKGDYLLAKKVTINQITDLRGDLIAYTYNDDNLVSLNVAFGVGYDVYLNSENYPKEFENMIGLVEYFDFNYYNDFLPRFIKDKTKGLAMLEKEHKKATKQVAKSNKVIEKSASVIKKSEKKIEALKAMESTDATNAKILKYEAKITEADSLAVYHAEIARVNKELIENLNPRIKSTSDDINSANLTLIEVRAKMKVYN